MRAYTELIQALHNMKRNLDISILAVMEGRDTDTDFHKEWSAKHRVAWDEIRKDIDIGDFLFSEMSIKILEALVDKSAPTPAGDWFSDMENMHTAVEKCLPGLG